MAHKGPGKAYREGIALIELFDMFPDEAAARDWFANARWGHTGRRCPRCGSVDTMDSKREGTYWCKSCRQRFTVRTGTEMERSKIPLRKWAIGIYLCATSLKGVSSMKLHRDLGITQKSAWFMAHRIRDALTVDGGDFNGPVEADETYIGGKRKNMSNAKRKHLAGTGRGPVGKEAVVGVKDRETKQVRAKVVEHTDKTTLQGFVVDNTADDATVYTDEAQAYEGMPRRHESVKHSVAEYVRDQAHTNGMESFWSMMKRGYVGTYHKMSTKHLQKYVQEFAGRHNMRELDTLAQMQAIVAAMVGKRLMYSDLVSN